MTTTEMFNEVAAHLLAQGKPALTKKPTEPGRGLEICAYRGDNGLACAVGCLMTPDAYDREMEGQSPWADGKGPGKLARNLIVRALRPEVFTLLTAEDETGENFRAADVLEDLQSLHDEGDSDRWASDLREVADRFDLDGAIVGTLQRTRDGWK